MLVTSKMYEIISRTKVQEPNRGQNYSEFYYTTYMVVKFPNIENNVDFKFLDETEIEIENILNNYGS